MQNFNLSRILVFTLPFPRGQLQIVQMKSQKAEILFMGALWDAESESDVQLKMD